ncbi:hypothetical protein FOZ63_010676 [Perkinsus olseni]|uniref:Uncharacterized protein n=1 Tax=Perkinsus olseni TaxID=32597 RepID=A0A7J6U151_PEROL|nr:hypothetical protein FOZ63_010676 [Perkinsus olseni]KAF4755807.1 hypothetical protein FOZ62_000404 [Perkinsus olseni]
MPTFIRFPALVGFMTAMASLRPPYIGVDMVSEVRPGLKRYAETSLNHLPHFQPLPPDSVVDDPQKKKVNIRKKENQCQFEYGKGGTRLTFKLEYDDYSASIERYEAGHSLKMKSASSVVLASSFLWLCVTFVEQLAISIADSADSASLASLSGPLPLLRVWHWWPTTSPAICNLL